MMSNLTLGWLKLELAFGDAYFHQKTIATLLEIARTADF